MLNLETADAPHKLRRVAIEPVTRVEGHGKVTILLDDDNHVHQVRLHIVEFRGFEAFIEGRPYWEVPVTVQRLCGICPVSHHLAAAKAMDVVAGYGPLTPTAEKLRRLLHYGQIVQSHALHFFHLASPDLLFGFESEVARAQHRRRRGGLPGSRQARRADAQIRAGSHPPHRRQAHPRHRGDSRRHEQGASRRRARRAAARHRRDRRLGARVGRPRRAAARDAPRLLQPLRRVARQHDGPRRRARRARLLSRRLARARSPTAGPSSIRSTTRPTRRSCARR